MKKISVLFVCMGNICRSPTAEGVFRQLLNTQSLSDKIKTDSAGTHAYHVGEPPDRRAQLTAKNRNIDLSDLRARKSIPEDFIEFDYVLAMDNDNYAILRSECPSGSEYKLKLFMDFAPQLEISEVPDPYYGGDNGFEVVFDMVQTAAEGLLEDIKSKHLY